MSCIKPQPSSADSPEVSNNQEMDDPETDGKDIYSELVQRSYDDLFEPWLKPEDSSEGGKPKPGQNPN